MKEKLKRRMKERWTELRDEERCKEVTTDGKGRWKEKKELGER